MDEEILEILVSKNSVAACAAAAKIVGESSQSDRWYRLLDRFFELLESKNSLVRNRAINIIAANAKWDKDKLLDKNADAFLSHITDEKPITARECIKALPMIAKYKPNLCHRMKAALKNADFSCYADSMRPLLERDKSAALSAFCEVQNGDK